MQYLSPVTRTDKCNSLSTKYTDVYIPPFTAKPEQQQSTMTSGVLTSICSRQRSTISGRPLPERKEFGPTVSS